ncbi:hypothetical protein BGX27_006376 [Mortierella sp. AM989]|nr:hypothetical protein BGX27_006376 [Mortierella sp. AM989]
MPSTTTLRITLALALVAFATQAVPIASVDDMDISPDIGSLDSSTACSQSVNSGYTSLESTVNTVPITDVTPINRYQPHIQAYAPIVQSECYQTLGYGDANNFLGSDFGTDEDFSSPIGSSYDDNYNESTLGSDSRLYRRDIAPFSDALDSSLNSAPSDYDISHENQEEECNVLIPQQNIDLGSSISMIPSTNVLPSTSYLPHVQSLESDIQAAPAESNSLPQQNVNLGSDVNIQPTTHVLPETTYQPSVHQQTTSIEAAPQQDQSLPQSSVQLGSNVQIMPTVRVQPLTVFQPSVQSLPIVIDVQPCNRDITYPDYDTFQEEPRFSNPSRGSLLGGMGSFNQEESSYQDSTFGLGSIDQRPNQDLAFGTNSINQEPYQPYQSSSFDATAAVGQGCF